MKSLSIKPNFPNLNLWKTNISCIRSFKIDSNRNKNNSNTVELESNTNNESKSENRRKVMVMEEEIKGDSKEYPEEPTTCCMSGCANCVWLDYAQKLSDYYKDGGDKAYEEINQKITDVNLRSFLLFELRMRKASQK